MALVQGSGSGGGGPDNDEKRRKRRQGGSGVPDSVVRGLFAYYSPTGRPQPPGLMKRARLVAESVPKDVLKKLIKNGGRIIFVHQDDVNERQPIPKEIQALIGGMDLGILGDVANMYAPAAAIDSGRPMVFVSTRPTEGMEHDGPKGMGTVLRHELGHSASGDFYIRRMLGVLYRGIDQKTPAVMPKTAEILEGGQQQRTLGPGFRPTLGHSDTTFPADKFKWPDRWPKELKKIPREWVNEEKWAESFAYYTDPKWRTTLHPDVQQYFRDVFGE